MRQSENITDLAAAICAAQGELDNASKNSTNPHFKSKYADLAEVLNTVRPVFGKHGLGVIQSPSYDTGIVTVETMILHKSGQYIANSASCKISKDDAQGVGSAVTYLRRYSLAAMAGIAQEDDDGEGSKGSVAARKPTPKPAPPAVDLFTKAAEAIGAARGHGEKLDSIYQMIVQRMSENKFTEDQGDELLQRCSAELSKLAAASEQDK